MTFDVSTVRPGWRGTDPDGGTWVLTISSARDPWVETTRGGVPYRRTQEEADAAGLVELRGVDELAQVIREVDGNHTLGAGALAEAIVEHLGGPAAAPAPLDLTPEGGDAAPAPLDPGNPEHLRQVAEFVREVPAVRHAGTYWLECSARECEDNADRLDREQREAEQNAADRERAEGMVSNLPEPDRGRAVAYILVGIRAERARAEQQEAK